jgi:hypothetical protein
MPLASGNPSDVWSKNEDMACRINLKSIKALKGLLSLYVE